MNPKKRLLSKSRFKIACECPTKLYFTGKEEYGNNNVDNAFLNALAEGGFQVGELAKMYHEGGIEIEGIGVEGALERTSSLLKSRAVTLYEPAIRHKDLLVRVDILIKNGNNVELIEVKAKSFDPSDKEALFNKIFLKKGIRKVNSEWEPYILDIAFQTYVVKKVFPNWKISSFLMLADKSAKASVDGINQRFFIGKGKDDRVVIEVRPETSRADLGEPLLVKVCVDDEVQCILHAPLQGQSFDARVASLASAYKTDKMIKPDVGTKCKNCEFRISEEQKSKEVKSGFDTCWKTAAHLSNADLSKPFVFDIWNFRKSQQLIEEGRFLMEAVTEEDVDPQPKEDESGLSSSERQWLQVEKVQMQDPTPYLDIQGMSDEMSRWRFPLHFIDFETTMVAIPFHKGRKPYEQIAFQFSHHLTTKEGKAEHRSEYINCEKGAFPNFEFVRQLRAALSQDNGTIFRFAAHENTVLCQIYGQLLDSTENDRLELCDWIRSITTSTGDSTDQWDADRTMIDMCELVKKYFYHPNTQGSNSIKKVLPAILGASTFLQERYSKNIYGSPDGIRSINFKNWRWIQKDHNGIVIDPYKLLPAIFNDIDLESMDALITGGNIADGGAAMTAYARMQFTQMSNEERERVIKALLRYCELDTFAMVMIYEYWKHEIDAHQRRVA